MATTARTTLSVLLIGLFCTLGSSRGLGAAYEPGRPIQELRLANGTVLHDVKIVATGATTLVATWEGGRGTILLSLLPHDLRSALDRQLEVKKASGSALETLSAADNELGADGVPFRIKLVNGFVMRECVILHWDEDSVTVRFAGGTVPVQFSGIDAAQRTLFEARRADAIKKQAQDAATARVSRESQRYKAELDAEISDKQELEKAIQKGLVHHYLVVGMTMDDARAIYGAPTTTSETIEGAATVHTQWTYARRKDSYLPNGTLQDTHLEFFDGKLKAWDPNMMVSVEVKDP